MFIQQLRLSQHSGTQHSVRNMALVKFVYGKFVYIRKFYKMFTFFTTMTSVDTRKSTLNYYIDTVNHAVFFAIAQLSCWVCRYFQCKIWRHILARRPQFPI